MNKLALAGSIAASLMLAGCGGSTAVSNPDYFSYKLANNALSGKYNPQGFTSEEVKKFLKSDCKGKAFSSYGEGAADADGLIPFTAVCKGGTVYKSGAASLQRQEDGGVIVEFTGA